MNHAITVGGLLLTLGIIGGLIGSAFGALMVFAGGMSDNPSAGNDAAGTGCLVLLGGLAMASLCALGLFF